MDARRPATADFDGGAKKESSIAFFDDFTSHLTRVITSTEAGSMSMGLRPELASPPPGARNALIKDFTSPRTPPWDDPAEAFVRSFK